MYDFSTTNEDKLLNYERFNPGFAVFNPLQQEQIEFPDTKPKGIASYTVPEYKTLDYTSQPIINEADQLEIQKAQLNGAPKSIAVILKKAKEDIAAQPVVSTSGNTAGFAQSIANVESDGGNYKAFNPAGGGEGAVGKYQFRWTTWKKDIGKHTGITNKEDFMNNPQAQEDYFKYYTQTTLKPQLASIKKEYPNSGFTDDELLKLLHFRGPGNKEGTTGLRKLLKYGGLDTKEESYNMSARGYLNASK